MGRIVFSFLLLVFSGAVYSGPLTDARIGIEYEYEIMDECVKGKENHRGKAIKVCACALEKTMENGFFPDYDNDEDYLDNKSEFLRKFEENLRYCFDNMRN